MNLFERIFASERDARPAILFEHQVMTYAQLRDETLRVVSKLNELGIEPDDRVALLVADSPEFVASFVAIISIGAIAVPINLALRREEQLFILKDCGARAVIIEAQAAAALLENSSPAELRDLLVVQRDHKAALPEIEGLRVHDLASAAAVHANEFDVSLGDASDTNADAFIL